MGLSDKRNRTPFWEWFEEQEPIVADRILKAITRIERGNLSNVKSVGEGVLEYRIDFGPDYRIYFGRDGERLILLLAGGTKKRQERDIEFAQFNWEGHCPA